MQIGSIDIPEPLIQAQQTGNLVVFAGAGVSKPPPSNYPDFGELADRLASGGLSRETLDEPIDRFLGRLHTSGIAVHERTREILSKPESKPNATHRSILGLFPSLGSVRIVTTNFDTHFDTAARRVFARAKDLQVYCGPALPLGSDFEGIVHLHGSVDQPSRNLILTDSDFGRAYLTEGWATRFLQGLFSHFTVLFVGYSHDDVVMNYLARGLPPGTTMVRYALTSEDPDGKWEFRGIVPIFYPLENGKHTRLLETINKWVVLGRMEALDHDGRIAGLTSLLPPLEKEHIDYLDYCLREAVTARFFVRHAKSAEWLCWVDDRHHLDSLFGDDGPTGDLPTVLSEWFAEHSIRVCPEKALETVRKHGGRISPVLWHSLVRALFSGQAHLNSAALGKWVTVLLENRRPHYSTYCLERILANCRHPADKAVAPLLFDQLTRPRTSLERRFGPDESGPITGIEIGWIEDQTFLRKAWSSLFLPHIDEYVAELEPTISAHLRTAHLLLVASDQASNAYDGLSFVRSAIEPHAQDAIKHGADFLIDAARDIVEWLIERRPSEGAAIVEKWIESEVPLIRRLAVHGVAESVVLSSDEKMQWLMDKELLYSVSLKHEVFRLLKQAYPGTTAAGRNRVVAAVRRGPAVDASKLRDKTRDYEVYNLSVWLNGILPACELTAGLFADQQAAHPEFSPREHPDFNHYFSAGTVDNDLPGVEELLAMEPREEVERLLVFLRSSSRWTTPAQAQSMVAQAVARSFDWGWKLASSLRERGVWASDAWEPVFSGWRAERLAELEWSSVIDLLSEQSELLAFGGDIADLLLRGLRDEGQGIPSFLLPKAELVLDGVWAVLESRVDSETPTDGDWLGKAINHPSGSIAMFWLHDLSRSRVEAGPSWRGIPEAMKTRLSRIIDGTSASARLGRVVVASQLHFIHSIDSTWARAELLPLLDWNIDSDRAVQAWQGFLTSGKWSEGSLIDLIPCYRGTFSHLEGFSRELRSRFAEHLASIAVSSTVQPLQDKWLSEFLVRVDPRDRVNWAFHVHHALSSLGHEGAAYVWRRWLREYWDRRISCDPIPLEATETAHMVEWVVPLRNVFGEVVDRICKSPVPSVADAPIYYSMKKERFELIAPDSLARLLHRLLDGAVDPFYYCSEVAEMVQAIVTLNVDRGELKAICNRLAALGCMQATDLAASL